MVKIFYNELAGLIDGNDYFGISQAIIYFVLVSRIFTTNLILLILEGRQLLYYQIIHTGPYLLYNDFRLIVLFG